MCVAGTFVAPFFARGGVTYGLVTRPRFAVLYPLYGVFCVCVCRRCRKNHEFCCISRNSADVTDSGQPHTRAQAAYRSLP